MSEDNAKLIAELLQRIDAVLATYIDEPIFDLLADCRAALSAQSEPEPLTGGEFDRMMQYKAQKEAAMGEPVAWMHNGTTGCDATPDHIAHAKVKALWDRVDPKHLEHYTIPLYAHPVASAQVPREPTEAMVEAARSLMFDANRPDFHRAPYRRQMPEIWRAMYDAALAEPGATELWPGRACTYRPRDDVTCLKPECRFDCAAWLKDHANG